MSISKRRLLKCELSADSGTDGTVAQSCRGADHALITGVRTCGTKTKEKNKTKQSHRWQETAGERKHKNTAKISNNHSVNCLELITSGDYWCGGGMRVAEYQKEILIFPHHTHSNRMLVTPSLSSPGAGPRLDALTTVQRLDQSWEDLLKGCKGWTNPGGFRLERDQSCSRIRTAFT